MSAASSARDPQSPREDGGEFRCARAAREREDPFLATAPPARRWLLVEHPGPWGPRALGGAGFDAELLDELDRYCRDTDARFQLIRRPLGHREDALDGARFAVVDTVPGAEGTRWGHVGDYRDLPAALAQAEHAVASSQPAYLVCTHGSHDPCCTEEGRPVVQELADARPERTWETTHTGGHRFAPNVVLLPHGIVLGRVPVARAREIADAYEGGHLDPALVRGRTGLEPSVQAAQHHARLALGETGVDALAPRGVEVEPDRCYTVALADRHGGMLKVRVRERWFPAPTPLSCSATEPGSMRTFDLVSITGAETRRRTS
jgi:hypothetical protein